MIEAPALHARPRLRAPRSVPFCRLCVAALLLVGAVEPARADSSAPTARRYEKARGVTADGIHITAAYDLRIDGDSMTFLATPEVARRISGTAGIRTLSEDAAWDPGVGSARPPAKARTLLSADPSAVRYLEVKTGTRALRYGAYAALLGLGSSVSAVLEVNADDQYENVSQPGLVIAAVTVGCGLIGAIIGGTSEVYQPLREKGRWIATRDCGPGLAPPAAAPVSPCHVPLLTLSF